MTVEMLLDEINENIERYGKKFLMWKVYTEQIEGNQKKTKRKAGNSIKDEDNWEYISCGGFWTKMPKEKIFTININY